jgi:quercetin dioxygenase-like cupin family protein/hemerythrin
MKRHRALVPLSNDHHHALVEARRLRRAAGGSGSRSAVADFLRFFAADTVRHFREEEEMLFPFVVGFGEAREPLVRALLEHQRLHALVRELDEEVERDAPTAKTMRELGELLEGHIRHEERLLFPLIERLLEDSGLAGLGIAQTEAGAGSSETDGPISGAESEDLNATLLTWRAGSGPPEHVNAERDVLVVVLDGSVTVALEGEERRLERGEAIIIPKGGSRAITAGAEGVRYLSIHRRRPRLQIQPAPRPNGPDKPSRFSTGGVQDFR